MRTAIVVVVTTLIVAAAGNVLHQWMVVQGRLWLFWPGLFVVYWLGYFVAPAEEKHEFIDWPWWFADWIARRLGRHETHEAPDSESELLLPADEYSEIDP